MAEQAIEPQSVAEIIGREYVETDRLPREHTNIVSGVYSSIGSRCEILLRCIPVPVVFQSDDPYSDYQDMAETVAEEQQLRVYNQHTNHPEFSHDEQLAFRAVHDWFGHLEADVDFSPEGEFKKWDHMRKHFTQAQNRVMFAEVVGQTGMVHYLDDGFESDRLTQRAFVAPDRWVDMMHRAVK